METTKLTGRDLDFQKIQRTLARQDMLARLADGYELYLEKYKPNGQKRPPGAESPGLREVVEINYEAMEVPEIVNEDPLSEGWLLKVELTSGLEFDDLFTEEEYEENLSEEEDLEED